MLAYGIVKDLGIHHAKSKEICVTKNEVTKHAL